MIEARFDDLTGAEPSFRLVEPVGVLEATDLAEVPGVLAAADAASIRGLWVAGFVAYEAAPGLDPALAVRPRTGGGPSAEVPLAWFGMFEGRQETALPDPPEDAPTGGDGAAWAASVDRAAYDEAIDRIRERIAAGDTYQVNHTLRLHATVQGDPRGLYRDLCHAQRGAYGAYLDTGRHRVLSASPELFFRIDGETISTKPMKGTAPRGRWLAEDLERRDRLQASEKDRAENAMIVDLLRNDIGRVAREGSVTWSDVFEAERYETVWQLTSTVSATLVAGATMPEIFRALFPCGSVTGAPKVATTRIIADLEDAPRGVYCGTVGYLAPPTGPGPRARFNVAIRTAVQDAGSGLTAYGVGGGITWDSSAGAEYDEAVAKARVLTERRPSFRLVETMIAPAGEPVRHLDRHLARLLGSATYFGFTADEAAIRAAVADVDDPARTLRLRLVLDRRGHVEVAAATAPVHPDTVTVAIDEAASVDPADVFLFHKTTVRRVYDEALDRHDTAQDVVLTNLRGEVTESTIANVAARIGDRWYTPPVDAGLLPGVGRAVALDEGRITERSLTVAELRAADEVALVSDNRGWRRATLV
ncbi:MAG TPA: aminodeoxychorismate synthase component I [Actinomycetota bacterium]|nr:aminodeoxychorismate synthase component I [Actinomycetota bacterium]